MDRDHEDVAGDRKVLQIYPPPSEFVSDFWRDKYEKEAKKYWDTFYKRNKDKFFKDRHYLQKEWGIYFQDSLSIPYSDNKLQIQTNFGDQSCQVLEAGCGVGNTVFPLLEAYPNLFVYACDFSPRAINLLKAHRQYNEKHIHAFVCDITCEDLTNFIPVHSIDVATLIFFLSAISPEKMPFVVQNIRNVLKSSGRVLVRDYASGDLAQERLSNKMQKISDNFYVRGDGTRAFYFTEAMLSNLFEAKGFTCDDIRVYEKKVENRAREITMNRRWIQAVFHYSNNHKSNFSGSEDTDLSEGIASEMFGIAELEVKPIVLNGHNFHIRTLSREYQHSCKSTGLMLWESAFVLATLLAKHKEIIASKYVLELGCGSVGICSIVASTVADLVVATDGDPHALGLLSDNVNLNNDKIASNVLNVELMKWGNTEHIEKVQKITNGRGFDLIIGSDVTYVAEAVPLLFATADALIAGRKPENPDPLLILCHVERQVNEATVIASAMKFGFRLDAEWANGKINPNDDFATEMASMTSRELSKAFALVQIYCFKKI